MTNLARTFSNLTDISTEDLRKELGTALEITAENLVWLARLWRELERRGEDLRELRSGLRTFLPFIADGRMDAQAAVQFAGNLTMLRALATLPIDEQRRLAAGKRVPVVLRREGELVTRAMRADELSAKMIRQVFTSGRVRAEEEQRIIVGTLQPARAEVSRKVERVKLDADKVATWRRLAERLDLSLEDLLDRAVQPILAAEIEKDRKRAEIA